MSIDWLLTRLTGDKSRNNVTQNTGEDTKNCEKVKNSQPKKAGKHARNADVTDQHVNEHSHCNSKKQESLSLLTKIPETPEI